MMQRLNKFRRQSKGHKGFRAARLGFFLLLILLPLSLTLADAQQPASAPSGKAPIIQLTMKGAITPAMDSYMRKGLARAAEENAQLIILALDTPGGLLSTTREMVGAITASPVPVAVWVTPPGGHAASAGTFITYAAHIAAMDHGTNIGAATPVTMGGGGMPGAEDDDEDRPASGAAMERKALQDTAAFIRGLAEMRGRNAEWAERAVTEAESITAEQALANNVIDYIATSRDDLLRQIDGRTITVRDDTAVTFDTAGAPVTEITPDWRTRLLILITDPNIAFILMSIGVYGVILEFFNPGTLIPGTVGVICLLLALYALNVLPINIAGAALMLAGIAFMVAESFMPSFGIMGFGGLVAFITGATIMFDTDAMPGMGLQWDIILAMAVLGALMIGLTMYVTMKVYRKKVTTGAESMIGDQAKIVEWEGQTGRVHIQGEIWRARSVHQLDDLQPGDHVMVVAIHDLELEIEAVSS